MENNQYRRPAAAWLTILALALTGCGTPEGQALGSLLDALGGEPASEEAKHACFSIEDYTERQECQARYDHLHRYDDLTR